MKKVIKIAITGKIGSGKTTLCKVIKELGYKVYESDNEVDQLLKENEIIKKIKLLYERKVANLLYDNGKINKKSFGDFLFSNKTELENLEKILYPLLEIRKKMFVKENINEKFIFFDIPLLFEKKMQKEFDKVIFLEVSEEIQKQRVMKRKGMSKSKLDNILNNQKYDISKFKQFISIEINSSAGKKILKSKIEKFLENF